MYNNFSKILYSKSANFLSFYQKSVSNLKSNKTTRPTLMEVEYNNQYVTDDLPKY